MNSLLRLSWASRWLPQILVAGVFPLRRVDNGIAYLHPTIALHLHEYRGAVRIGGRLFALQPGDVTLSPPMPAASTYELEEDGDHFCTHFQAETGGGGEALLRFPLHFRLGPLAAAARERFWRLIDYYQQMGGRPDSPAGGAAAATLQEFLLWLHLRNQPRAQTRVQPRRKDAEEGLAQLRRIIDASLAKPLSVPDLAQATGFSADALSRLFGRRYGMSIPHYLLQRRMELARHLLLRSNAPILEVGRQVGIPDPQYFNKQFRRVTGQSPSLYRLRHRPDATRGKIGPGKRSKTL